MLWIPLDGTVGNRGSVQSVVACDPTCPATVAGKRVAAGGFDGATTAIRIADRPELHASVGTVAMWIRPTVLPSLGEARSIAGAATGNASLNSWEVYFYDNSGTLELITGGDAAGGPQLHFPWTLGTGTWFHVAATWDGTTQHMYLDGAQVVTGPQFAIEYTGHDVLIGADETPGGLTHYFDGDIDDVRFYSRALSPSEISLLAAP